MTDILTGDGTGINKNGQYQPLSRKKQIPGQRQDGVQANFGQPMEGEYETPYHHLHGCEPQRGRHGW